MIATVKAMESDIFPKPVKSGQNSQQFNSPPLICPIENSRANTGIVMKITLKQYGNKNITANKQIIIEIKVEERDMRGKSNDKHKIR